MLLLVRLLWLCTVAIYATEMDCSERLDVITARQWPTLRGFRTDLLNKASLAAVGVPYHHGKRMPHAVLHTRDRRTYLRGNSSDYHLWPRFNIKMSSYQYRKSHCGDKTVVRSSYLYNGISYTDPCQSNTTTREITEMRGLALQDIRFGYDFIAILTKAGNLWTIGLNQLGQLGHHDTQSQKLFSKIERLPRIKQIAVGGGQHMVALAYNGTLFSWGRGDSYRLGYIVSNSSNPIARSIAIPEGWSVPKQLCCMYSACAILMDNHRVITWGLALLNGRSMVDVGPGPIQGIPPDDNITQISCGLEHALALSSTGKLYGWGRNHRGELLRQAEAYVFPATEVDLDSKIVRGVVAGSYLTIIKTYSEEPGYLGHYDGQDTLGHDAPQQACGLVNDRDALAHGWFEETWGAVHLGCQAGDNERE